MIGRCSLSDMLRRGRLGLAVVFMALVWGTANAGQILYIYTWSDYFDTEVIDAFEKKYDCKIVFDYFDSGEAMYAKLRAKGGGYDVITPQTYMSTILFRQKMILPLDHAALPNLVHLDEKFPRFIEDSKLEYSIPYTRAVSGVGYNRRQIRREDLGSWDIFANPAYAKRMTMLNDMRETMGAALKYLGYSLNTRNATELREAADLLIKWKQNLAKFDVDEAKIGLDSGEFHAVHSYNGDIGLVMQENPDIDFYVPREGVSFGVDVFVIDATSRVPDLAHAFINHLLDPEMAAKNMEFTRYYQPVPKGIELLPRELRDSPAFMVPDDVVEKSEVLWDMGPENEVYAREWSRVKSH